MDETRAALPAAYEGLEPAEVWRHFAALNAIPRPSGHEGAARRFVQGLADAAGLPWSTDAAGNLVVRLPATHPAASPGGDAPTVIVQSHLDMVCEARPGLSVDWLTDPIRPQRAGEVIRASGTTLGADNGIGAAMAMALITAPGLEHGPLELLFTVEEEVGLTGAMALDGSLLQGRLLVNLDSEDPEELTIGCAGGRDVWVDCPQSRQAVQGPGLVGRTVAVSGLKGGHSGVQIAEPLANAIKVLSRALRAVSRAGIQYSIATLTGGSRSNAIPRGASALVAIAAGAADAFDGALQGARSMILAEWGLDEPGLALEWSGAAVPETVLSSPSPETLVGILEALPHGVLAMSGAFPTKVQTSSNLAQADSTDAGVQILVSVRSLDEAGLDDAEGRVRTVAQAQGCGVRTAAGYPPWPPDPGAALCQAAVEMFTEVRRTPPKVEVIHAGLECGVIVAKVPGMQAVSFGPRISSPHTPDEHVAISTVGDTWRLLTGLLARLAEGDSRSDGDPRIPG